MKNYNKHNMWPAQRKPTIFVPQLNLILLPQPTDTLNGYPSSVYPMLNVNLYAFLKGILPTTQSHDWNNDINAGRELGGGDLILFPLRLCSLIWHGLLCRPLLVSRLLQGCPGQGFLPTSITFQPTHPTPPSHPYHPSLL